VFANIVLADEVNRGTPKTQSALLEVMAEGRVTADGTARPVPQPFLVVATQNPIELEGTFPLPEAQLDRFLLKITIGYPGAEAERAILDRYVAGFSADRAETYGIKPVLSSGELVALRQSVATVHVEPTVRDYITRIVRATREEPSLALGASPRAGVSLFLASRAEAFLAGRDFVTPDDVKMLVLPVLRHRVVLTPEAEVEGQTVDQRLAGLLTTIPAPRGAEA
jgi:MoxR-like ATPase